MDSELQRRVQRYGWDKAAKGYWKRQVRPAQVRLLEMAQIRPGEHVIDVACGTGLVTFPAAEAVGESGRVVGTDISDEMIRGVRREAAPRGVEHASFERMDAESLELGDEEFDVALCSLGLMYVPDPLAALKEMHRVLKPGGRYLQTGVRATVAGGPTSSRSSMPAFSPMSAPCSSPWAWGTASRGRAKRAGFAEVDALRLSTPLHYDSAEDTCGAAFVGGPVALAYSRFDEKTREEAHAECITSIRPYLKDGVYDIPGEFVVVRGDKS